MIVSKPMGKVYLNYSSNICHRKGMKWSASLLHNNNREPTNKDKIENIIVKYHYFLNISNIPTFSPKIASDLHFVPKVIRCTDFFWLVIKSLGVHNIDENYCTESLQNLQESANNMAKCAKHSVSV